MLVKSPRPDRHEALPVAHPLAPGEAVVAQREVDRLGALAHLLHEEMGKRQLGIKIGLVEKIEPHQRPRAAVGLVLREPLAPLLQRPVGRYRRSRRRGLFFVLLPFRFRRLQRPVSHVTARPPGPLLGPFRFHLAARFFERRAHLRRAETRREQHPGSVRRPARTRRAKFRLRQGKGLAALQRQHKNLGLVRRCRAAPHKGDPPPVRAPGGSRVTRPGAGQQPRRSFSVRGREPEVLMVNPLVLCVRFRLDRTHNVNDRPSVRRQRGTLELLQFQKIARHDQR